MNYVEVVYFLVGISYGWCAAVLYYDHKEAERKAEKKTGGTTT